MIMILVKYRTKTGERDAFVKALLSEGIPACTQKENGNLCYDFSLSIEDPDAVFLVEQWKDPDCLQEHASQPMYRRLGELRKELSVERETFVIYDAQPRGD